MDESSIPIFLISNDRYVPFLCVTIASILYHTRKNIVFYIIESDISSFRKKQILEIESKFQNCKIEFIKANLDKFAGFFVRENFTRDTYSKFLIPDIRKNIDKAIYLDSDTIVLGDIAELYNQDLNGMALGAVEEFADKKWRNKLKKAFGINGDLRHFNSGVLLIDCKKWRQEGITEKLLDLAKRYASTALLQDQGILNKYFHQRYAVLDNRYNLTIVWEDAKRLPADIKNRIKEAKKNTIVRHFIYDKPWESNKYISLKLDVKVHNFDEFWFFAKMTPFYEGIMCNYIASINE